MPLHIFTAALGRPNDPADAYRIREAYTELRTALDTDGMLATNISALEPRGLTPGLLVQHLSTIPFLAAARVVVVEGLLQSIGGARGVVAHWQSLLDALPQLPPTNHLVLLEFVPEREDRQSLARSPLLRALRALPDVDYREFAPLRLFGRDSGNEVARWVRERAQRRGVAIDARAAETLTELVGADLWTVASELDKLATYAMGRAITEADVRLLTPAAREADIFALVDAAVEGRAHEALRRTRDLLQSGSESPPYIQAMIARQLRHLVRAAELIELGEEGSIGGATGVTHPFPLRRLTEQARTVGRAYAEAALRAVEESDFAVKSGQTADAVALELLYFRLAELRPGGLSAGASPQRRAQRG